MPREEFGTLENGQVVEAVRLARPNGLDLRVITFGAVLQALHVPDAFGRMADVVLGHDDLESYRLHRQFFGAAIGRFSNRIAGGRFDLDGATAHIPPNEGLNALHGGPQGFDQCLWTIEEVSADPVPLIRLSLVSDDGDQGFPGEVQAHVTYSLTADTELSITFEATTTRPTVVGLTHHSYFNLGGVETLSSAMSHQVQIEAAEYLPLGHDLVPEGAPQPVAGTAFDFRTLKAASLDLRRAEPQMRIAQGYDHCFCLSRERQAQPRLVARLDHPQSGRCLELLTDQPGLQLYSGNMLTGGVPGKYNQLYRQGDAICLEPQAWPDAPNRPDFPSARLDPGQTYRHRSIYRFSAQMPA